MRLTRSAKTTGVLAIVVAIFAALVGSLFYAPQTSFPVPAVNAYDDFLRAAALTSQTINNPEMRRIYEGYLTTASKEDLRDWMWEGAEAISVFDKGLAKASCCVHIQPTTEFREAHSLALGQLKLLTHFLVARAQLAALEGSTNEALKSDLEAYDFAKRMGNGGLTIDFLVSHSCRAIVLKHIESLIPSLDQQQCTDALIVLCSTNQDETAASVVARTFRLERAIDPCVLAKARMAFWIKTILEICKTRSLAPLDALPKRVLEKRQKNIDRTLESVKQQLRRQQEISARRPEERN